MAKSSGCDRGAKEAGELGLEQGTKDPVERLRWLGPWAWSPWDEGLLMVRPPLFLVQLRPSPGIRARISARRRPADFFPSKSAQSLRSTATRGLDATPTPPRCAPEGVRLRRGPGDKHLHRLVPGKGGEAIAVRAERQARDPSKLRARDRFSVPLVRELSGEHSVLAFRVEGSAWWATQALAQRKNTQNPRTIPRFHICIFNHERKTPEATR